MSIGGTHLTFSQAFELAKHIHAEFVPVCERVKIAGSLRRRKGTVSDLEFVIEPKKAVADLFGTEKHDVDSIKAVALSLGTILKGGDKYIQVGDAGGASGVKLDIFIVTPPANWWCILAIRTGPWDLGKVCMEQFNRYNLKHDGGRLLDRHGNEVPVESEEDFFRHARMPYFKPHLRDTPEAKTPLPASDDAKALLREACQPNA